MKKSIRITFFFAAMIIAGLAHAQDHLRLANGNVVVGRVVENGTVVRIVTSSGDTLTFGKAQVVDVATGQVQPQPEVSKRGKYTHYSDKEAGWWIALNGDFCYTFYQREGAFVPGFRLTSGYRFSEFIRIGMGVGVQYVTQNIGNIGKGTVFVPIFLAARGNMFSDTHRMMAPYWNFAIGYTVPGGFTVSPEIGLRFGSHRHALTLSIGYLLQAGGKVNGAMNTAGLGIGYEF